MAIFATSKGGGERKLPPAGTHIARCYSIIDIGTQESTFNGDVKTARKVRISFELPNEQEVFAPERGPEPFTITKEFTLSLHKKAALRKSLESWRGKPFTDAEAEKFDVSCLIGVPAMVSISHEPKKDGDGNFAKLLTISTMMKGMACPPAILKPVEYSIESGRDAVYNSLPDWLKEKLNKCKEWTAPAPSHVEAPPDAPDDERMPF